MAGQFKNLFSPLKVGTMHLRNRICSLPHLANFPEPSTAGWLVNVPGDKYVAYWEERARGGAGLIATHGHTVSLEPRRNHFQHPEVIERFKKATEAIHRHGACASTQINNPGAQVSGAPNQVIDFPALIAPSNIPSPHCWRIPHQLTIEEIHELTRIFAQAAMVVREGSFDAVEVHLANGYLLNQFLSPLTNSRTDEYGGSMENRMRFPIEAIKAVRAAVGNDFCVGTRLTADEFTDGGYTLDDMMAMAPLLVKAGNLDYVNVAVGIYRSIPTQCTSMYFPVGNFAYCAAAIKQVVDVPVMCVGRINDAVQAEKILEDHQADVIGTNRSLICDPEWPNKAREGRLDEIRKCIGCNEGCWGRRRLPTGITCAMNPVVGRETEKGWLNLEHAARKKKVMVVGGGPAGSEAARVAKLRGHEVTLYEKGSELGGMTNVAAKAPGRLDFAEVGRYYTQQMKLLGVTVHLDTKVTPETVRREQPDALVVATGSVPLPLAMYTQISGADQPNVVEVKDVLTGKVNVGRKVLVVDMDQTIQALSTADFLASQGKQVEVIGEDYYIGTRIDNIADDNIRRVLYQRLLENDVVLSPLTKLKEVSGTAVVVMNAISRRERVIEDVDNVVYCCGDRENSSLYYVLKDEIKEIYRIGDCANVRKLLQAVYEGAVVGRKL